MYYGYKNNMNDIERYKRKKVAKVIGEITESTKSIGVEFGEAFHKFAYYIREMDSQIKANERNNNKLK